MPILIMWFGIGEVPAMLTAFLISFFPIVVNVATGLATIEPELEDVLRALGARKLDIMLKVGIPRSLPYLVRLAQGRDHARLRRHRGVGDASAPMPASATRSRSPARTSRCRWCSPALLLLAVEGIAMYAVFAEIEVYFTRWAFRSSMSAAA